jgi:hypothetical protein
VIVVSVGFAGSHHRFPGFPLVLGNIGFPEFGDWCRSENNCVFCPLVFNFGS